MVRFVTADAVRSPSGGSRRAAARTTVLRIVADRSGPPTTGATLSLRPHRFARSKRLKFECAGSLKLYRTAGCLDAWVIGAEGATDRLAFQLEWSSVTLTDKMAGD